MNRPNYFNVIEERLNLLAERIESRGRLNMLELNIHAESFYQHFLNELFGWAVLNENEIKQNAEAIDLVDHTNKLIIQVSSTASKQKIESSLLKDTLKKYNGYTFKFILIARDADKLRNKTFENPHGIAFSPAIDIIDKNSILSKIRGLNIDDLERIYKFVKKELVNEIDPLKLESNLATVINILSKEDWDKSEPISEINSFEIDRKISFNKLSKSKEWIDEYYNYYKRINDIYSEFDKLGSNKSKTVLAAFKNVYLKAKNEYLADELFDEIINKITERVLNSSNYEPIPIEELEQSIRIITVDAFIRCKIFENPESYNYATT